VIKHYYYCNNRTTPKSNPARTRIQETIPARTRNQETIPARTCIRERLFLHGASLLLRQSLLLAPRRILKHAHGHHDLRHRLGHGLRLDPPAGPRVAEAPGGEGLQRAAGAPAAAAVAVLVAVARAGAGGRAGAHLLAPVLYGPHTDDAGQSRLRPPVRVGLVQRWLFRTGLKRHGLCKDGCSVLA
jgi:hypothetical protein